MKNGLFAQYLRYAQNLILGISRICLRLNFSHALILNENSHFSRHPKDVTGDGRDEKLVFHYTGADYKSLKISFSIFQINSEGKATKKIFYTRWYSSEAFRYESDRYSSFKIKTYMTDFLGRICIDSSKNKMCQTNCLERKQYSEKEIKKSIEKAIRWIKFVEKRAKEALTKKMVPINLSDVIDLNRINWKGMSERFGPVTVKAQEIEQVFKELFLENDIPCFSYLPYAKLPKMYIWCPSLGVFISIAS